MNARRSSVSIIYSGIDITKEINEDLLSFHYTDNASGNSDDIGITLKDERKKWLNDWFPDKGDVIKAEINTLNWRRDKDKQKLPCGLFYIDNPSYSGRPRELTIAAISSPLNSNFEDVERTKLWRNISIRAIANDIATRSGLGLEFIGGKNPRYYSIEQTETPDSTFLANLCEIEGLAMKVTDSKIVIFDESVFEKREPVATYRESNDTLLAYSFSSSLSNTAYDGVNVKYKDSKTGKTIEFLYSVGQIDKDSKIFQLNSKVRDGDEARRLAQSKLRNLNKNEVTGNLTLVGNIDLLGSSCIELLEFGKFSGKYYITLATHSISGGYTTTIEIRKVLEGY